MVCVLVKTVIRGKFKYASTSEEDAAFIFKLSMKYHLESRPSWAFRREDYMHNGHSFAVNGRCRCRRDLSALPSEVVRYHKTSSIHCTDGSCNISNVNILTTLHAETECAS